MNTHKNQLTKETIFKGIERGYRYVSEGFITFSLTYGQLIQPEIASFVAASAYHYQAAAVAAFYLIDFCAYSLLHPAFYDQWSKYHDRRPMAMLMRGSRNLLQVATTFAGYHLFTHFLLTGTMMTQVSAAVALLLFKALIDITYDLLEAKVAAESRFGNMSFTGRSFSTMNGKNNPDVDTLLKNYEKNHHHSWGTRR